ncbi:uncharacterized protein LOC129625557 [Bubalus kerabau]|uniref:uncharacterized protein LOC129625557 n=1 Tax=Bubalus carabanensis TaxID=3119969 RepID=UPI00244EB0F4|nr:uncharacterized protein LOC129625557 [Bubalus carabanensis]
MHRMGALQGDLLERNPARASRGIAPQSWGLPLVPAPGPHPWIRLRQASQKMAQLLWTLWIIPGFVEVSVVWRPRGDARDSDPCDLPTGRENQHSGFPRPLPPWNGPWGHGSLVTDFSARRQHSGCSERGAAQPRLLGTDAPRLWGCPQELPLFGLIPVWTPDFLCEQSTQKEKNLERREAGGGRGRHLHSGTRRPGFFLVRGRWRSFWEPLRVYFYLPTNWSLIRKKTLG